MKKKKNDVITNKCTLIFTASKRHCRNELTRKFAEFGKIKELLYKEDQVFVEYYSEEAAQVALTTLFDEIPTLSVYTDDKSRKMSKTTQSDLGASRTSINSCVSGMFEFGENEDAPCNLILGNLPMGFRADDVGYLVEEVNPLFISSIYETKVLNLNFCQIGLDSHESMSYLIQKLDGFIMKGQKLIAVDMEALYKRQ